MTPHVTECNNGLKSVKDYYLQNSVSRFPSNKYAEESQIFKQ